jgi:hypothetical protein
MPTDGEAAKWIDPEGFAYPSDRAIEFGACAIGTDAVGLRIAYRSHTAPTERIDIRFGIKRADARLLALRLLAFADRTTPETHAPGSIKLN